MAGATGAGGRQEEALTLSLALFYTDETVCQPRGSQGGATCDTAGSAIPVDASALVPLRPHKLRQPMHVDLVELRAPPMPDKRQGGDRILQEGLATGQGPASNLRREVLEAPPRGKVHVKRGQKGKAAEELSLHISDDRGAGDWDIASFLRVWGARDVGSQKLMAREYDAQAFESLHYRHEDWRDETHIWTDVSLAEDREEAQGDEGWDVVQASTHDGTSAVIYEEPAPQESLMDLKPVASMAAVTSSVTAGTAAGTAAPAEAGEVVSSALQGLWQAAINAAEDLTGLDIDGDGQVGGDDGSGDWCGVGLVVGLDSARKQLIVTGLVPGAPADRCRLIKRGDFVEAVDGVGVETVHDWRHLPRREALLFWARRLMGPENTRVVLHFRRAATRQQRGSKFRIALYRARPHHHEVCVCERERVSE